MSREPQCFVATGRGRPFIDGGRAISFAQRLLQWWSSCARIGQRVPDALTVLRQAQTLTELSAQLQVTVIEASRQVSGAIAGGAPEASVCLIQPRRQARVANRSGGVPSLRFISNAG